MKSGFKVLILGEGRIACAVGIFLAKAPQVKGISFFKPGLRVDSFDLLIGALPGDLGELPLQLALKHKKNLVDISDVEPQVYLKKNKEILQKGIKVIPCCGFCPGLLNFILGRELSSEKNFKKIEISAGSLSPQKYYFPFLWCFEDLILEHRIPSWQIFNSRIIKFKPFDGFQEERFFGIPAESYFAQSGFENMLKKIKVNNFVFRVVRPRGFREFFNYLENEGFLEKDTLPITKNIVEKNVKDNLSIAEVNFINKDNRKRAWQIKSFSRAGEKLNSMQKITAATPVAIAKALFSGKITPKGLLFMEELGQDNILFKEVLKENNKEGILIRRRA